MNTLIKPAKPKLCDSMQLKMALFEPQEVKELPTNPNSEPSVCCDCKAVLDIFFGRNSRRWMAIHKTGCHNRAVSGETKDQVRMNWENQIYEESICV